MFENIKQKILERQARDGVKSILTYKPSKNSEETITEEVIMKRSKLPLIGDWGRIYPAVNEDKTWNIQNLLFGGRKNLIKLIIVGTIIAMILLGYADLFSYISILEEGCLNLLTTLIG